MPSFLFEIDFEVYCGTCGTGLCNQSDGSNEQKGPRVTVEVCPYCRDEAKSEGHAEGHDEAVNEKQIIINSLEEKIQALQEEIQSLEEQLGI